MSGRSSARSPVSADVVIAGASFAGLAVAREVPGRALLVDPVAVGDGQTSACGAPVAVLDALGARASIQQSHDSLIFHTPAREVRWPLPDPFCTFDYQRCCLAALEGTNARVIQAAVRGRRGATVITTAGEVAGRVLVDCTGWRAVLSRAWDGAVPGSRGASPVRRLRYFGLEAEVEADFPPGLHFYFWPEIARDGYAWAFPAGRVTRIGVLSYRGSTRLRPGLDAFLHRLGMPAGTLHGGFLTGSLGRPVVDGVFVAGDAAGQCLPLTGEGIRTAVWAGRACGRLIRRVLDGSLTPEEARARYQALVMRQRRRYRALRWATLAALVLPPRALGLLTAWIGRPGPLRVVMGHYLRVFAESAEVGSADTPWTDSAHRSPGPVPS